MKTAHARRSDLEIQGPHLIILSFAFGHERERRPGVYMSVPEFRCEGANARYWFSDNAVTRPSEIAGSAAVCGQRSTRPRRQVRKSFATFLSHPSKTLGINTASTHVPATEVYH